MWMCGEECGGVGKCVEVEKYVWRCGSVGRWVMGERECGVVSG